MGSEMCIRDRFSIGIHVQPPAVLVRSCWPLLLNLASVYQRVWTRTTGVFLRVDSLVLLLPSLSSIFPSSWLFEKWSVVRPSSWLFEKWSVVRPFSPFSGVVAPPADYENKIIATAASADDIDYQVQVLTIMS